MTVSGWIGSATLVLVVAIGAFATIREKLIDLGLDRPRWIMRQLERTHRRAAARRITRDVGLLGSEFFEHSGNAIDVALSAQKLSQSLRSRPDQHLVVALRDWTIDLGDADFQGLRHYVNTMGGVSYSEDRETEFANIAHSWISTLQASNKIKPFDCLLGIKDGNPILVHSLARRMCRSEDRPIRSVFCKGSNDPARVSQRHETDFEGLRVFRDEQPIPRAGDGRYRAIAVDDNCTSGRSLLDAIARFNDFIAHHNNDYPFAPVDTAVVLFIVRAQGTFAFDDQSDVDVHALLALGDEEMKQIARDGAKRLKRQVGDMKDSSACEFSRTLG